MTILMQHNTAELLELLFLSSICCNILKKFNRCMQFLSYTVCNLKRKEKKISFCFTKIIKITEQNGCCCFLPLFENFFNCYTLH